MISAICSLSSWRRRLPKEKINSYFRDIYLASEQFSGTLQKAFRKSSTVRSEYERTYVVQSRQKKRTKREPGDRVTRNDKERRTKCMRESRGSWGRQTAETTEHEVVRPFKSRFFWPHRHSQNPSIYRSMSNKATCTNRPCFA